MRFMKRWAWVVVSLAVLAGAAAAQVSPEAAPPADPASAGTLNLGGDVPAAKTLVKATATPVTLGPNGQATTTVHLVILPSWHINANPPALEYNIPTRVFLRSAFGVRAGSPVYPAPTKVKVAFEESELWVWDGEASVTVPLTTGPSPGNGRHVLRGRVEYQGCNDQVCLAPVSVPFTVEVTVKGGVDSGFDSAGAVLGAAPPADTSGEERPARGTGFATTRPVSGAAAPSGNAAQRQLQDALASGGLGWFLALFVGGLLLNLTPCVFPMLGITVSIFGGRRKEAPARVIANAIVYVLGICVTYSALGVVAALTGGLFGAALQNPWVNVALGALLIVLSLSMFGVYEMQAPTWVLDKAGGANTGSLAGLFVSGLAVGIVAAPCVGPFVVALLAILAQRGDVAFGFSSMFTLSLGLGFPYLFLAAFSSALQSLPRSGEWMEWVKKLFGVILATFGLSYALLGLAPRLAPYLMPAALVLGGLYLGFMEKSANARRGFKLMKNLGGALAVITGVLLVLQITTAAARSVTFRPYDETAVKASLAGGRGVLLDFSADWCVPCHELELQTFPDPRVVAAARGFDAYKVDLTNDQSAEVQQRRERYAVAGVPTVVFLAPDGREVRAARVEGFVNAAEFVKRLELASGAKR
jgi:thiol:disulfide interchange protein DsbD